MWTGMHTAKGYEEYIYVRFRERGPGRPAHTDYKEDPCGVCMYIVTHGELKRMYEETGIS